MIFLLLPSILLAYSFSLSYVSLSLLSHDHVSLLANLFTIQEPTSDNEVKHDDVWIGAMQKELDALETNQPWDLTVLPPGHKALPSKWVYKLKFKADGSIYRPIARLVIKGFNQELRIDYKHKFAPIEKLAIVNIIIAVAPAKSWPLHRQDVNNAFLHGYLDEGIYMIHPQGYSNAGLNQVCKLKRSLYSLKQASKQWNMELTKFLVYLGFILSTNDHSLFTKSSTNSFIIALVCVDDILLTGSCISDIQPVKKALHDQFTIKDLGSASYFLGMELLFHSYWYFY